MFWPRPDQRWPLDKLTLGGESAVGVELALPHHARRADEVRVRVRGVVTLVAGVELLEIAGAGDHPAVRLAGVAGSSQSAVRLVLGQRGDELAARVRHWKAARGGELRELGGGHLLKRNPVDLNLVRARHLVELLRLREEVEGDVAPSREAPTPPPPIFVGRPVGGRGVRPRARLNASWTPRGRVVWRERRPSEVGRRSISRRGDATRAPSNANAPPGRPSALATTKKECRRNRDDTTTAVFVDGL